MHSENHFLKKVCLGDSFPSQVSSSCKSGKFKCQVTHHWTNYANKNYGNLWFISIQVTKDFRFQRNKNVCFISGNFSSERFSWKVKTLQCVLDILINKHLRLEFTILTLSLPDQIWNSSYCQPYNSCKVNSENLVFDQLIIPKLIFVFILITYLVDIVWIL